MEDLPEEMVDRIRKVNRLATTQKSLPAKLEAVVALAKRTVTNCDAAGIALLIEGEPTSAGVTDRVVVEVDLVQYETGEGPCLASMSTGNIVRIDVVEEDIRFPRFAPGAIDAGIQSVLSLPLRTSAGVSVGALNLYSTVPNAFDEKTELSAAPLADYAADAISRSPLYAYSVDMLDGLVATVEDRAILNQAIGFIMAHDGCSEGDAFERLRATALVEEVSLQVVAQRVVDERRVPLPRDAP